MLDPFYLIVDSADWIERLLPHGVRLVQLRVKDRPAAFIHSEMELGCDYVHLGQEDLDTVDLPALREAGVQLGLSTHDEAELERALGVAPDYVALGPIYHTRLKAMAFGPQGLETLALWKKRVGAIPLVGIGGVTLERAPGVLEAGADVAAVVTDITLAPDPEARTRAWVARPRPFRRP